MTPAQRGRALSRAVGVKRRLEARKRDGVLSSVQAAELREARLTLESLQGLDIALRGTDLTLGQARARRTELRRQLGVTGRSRKRKGPSGDGLARPSTPEREQAFEELRSVEAAIATDAASAARRTARGALRAEPKRVTSVVNGGLPGLGKR